MRRISLVGVLALALGGRATRGASETPAVAVAGALPLRAGGPTLILGAGARIESVDPDSGRAIGSIAPIAVSDFTWTRFLRRGRFLLAEGATRYVQEPVRHATRGFVLLDETGRVRWVETHAVTMNRASHAVFLDGEGNVAFDKLDGPLLITPDGTRVAIGYPPAGPVLHGTVDVLPLKPSRSETIDRWFMPASRTWANEPPATITKQLLQRPTPAERDLTLVPTVDVAPEDEMWQADVTTKTAPRLPLPPACRGARHWVSRTMSPRHWILQCAPDKEEVAPKWTMFVVDVEARRVRRLTPPPMDQSGVPRDFRQPDLVHADAVADGTIVATVWNHCTTSVYVSTTGGGWKKNDLATPRGAAFAPEPVCGHLTLQTNVAGAIHCRDQTGTTSYVRRPDGSWLTLPYRISAPQSGSCSSDTQVVAFVAGDGLITERLDREERKVVRAGVNKDAPLAWLP